MRESQNAQSKRVGELFLLTFFINTCSITLVSKLTYELLSEKL